MTGISLSLRLRNACDWVGLAPSVALAFVIAATLLPYTSPAEVLLTQDIDLNPGWNSVYLEVEPLEADPNEIFSGIPVDVVASYMPARSGMQFVEDPSANLLSVYGWSVWYAPERPDAFLTDLFALSGATPYLIHARTNATVSITGEAVPGAYKWTADAYNFVGFPVADPGGPTYEEFFRGDEALDHDKVYRLVNGTWRQVLDPSATVMHRGEAFWIYCDGHSDYPGPLEIETSSVLGVFLSSISGSDVVLRNRTTHPIEATVEHITAAGEPVPMALLIDAVIEEPAGLTTLSANLDGAGWTQSLPPLEAGEALRLPLELRLSEMPPGTRASLLKVTSDIGTEAYIPVTSTRDGQ